MVRVGGVVAAQRAQERKDVLAHDGVHVRRREVLESRPAQVVVRAASALPDAVFPLREDAALYRTLEPGSLALRQHVQVVEPAEKQKVGDLLDDFEGVGDAAGPEASQMRST